MDKADKAKLRARYEPRADKTQKARAEHQRQLRAVAESERAFHQRVARHSRYYWAPSAARGNRGGGPRRRREMVIPRRGEAEEEQRAAPDQVWPPYPVLNDEKRIARNLASAIARLEENLQKPKRQGVIARATYRSREQFAEFELQLKYWRECFEGWGGKQRNSKKGKSAPKQGRQGSLFPGPGYPSVEQLVKRDAAETAYQLFISHGLRPTATQQSEKTKASDYCRVAALLYGDKHADLYHQCRKIKERAAAVAIARAARRRGT